MDLTSFRTLGRSGLVVSPLALGTMTFAAPGWGSADDTSQDVFNAYVDAGGNFVDTADVYGGGRSEEIVGECIAQRSLRNSMVLATKFTSTGNLAIRTPAATDARTSTVRWRPRSSV